MYQDALIMLCMVCGVSVPPIAYLAIILQPMRSRLERAAAALERIAAALADPPEPGA